MGETTTPGDSQAAVPESNQHSSLIPTAARTSYPTHSSQTSLCDICAHGLRLDDRCAGGALEEPRNDDTPKLCFPFVGERRKTGSGGSRDSFVWKGGAQYEQRDVTPPHLPELLDECKFCHAIKSLLLNQLGKLQWWQTTTKKVKFEVQYEWTGSKEKGCSLDFRLVSLKLAAKHPELEYGPRPIEFPIAASAGPCQEWLHITGRPVDSESPFSERNVNLIRSWLEQCNADPDCCSSAKQEEFLPTRLLDLGAQRMGNLPITLVDTGSMAQLRHEDRPLKYICLSYCWGAAQPPLKTTTSTIEDYKAGIPMESMPRVFRDAVLVARTLGVRYLWIDALCIIQDCDGDWHNESAAMADVFSHSWMTIGAATASSCHDTLFYPRQNLSIDIEFQSSIKRDITGTISILLLTEYFRNPLAEAMKNSTWNTRGWVWQEQKLPQRLLIFGEKMLHFRCHQRMLHEYGRNSHNHIIPSESPKVYPDGPDRWTLVMQEYSRRKLSKGSDRLAAISGFAKSVSQELQDTGKSATYIAGIWLTDNTSMFTNNTRRLTDNPRRLAINTRRLKDSIRIHIETNRVRQLCWFVENPTLSFGQLLGYHKDAQQYIAPSWSWVALNQPVHYLDSGSARRLLFQVITHNIKPARSDPTVAIAPGSSITLFGKLRKVPTRPSMGTKISRPWPDGTQTRWEAHYTVEKVWHWREKRERDVVGKIEYFLDWDPSTQDVAEGNSEALLELFLLQEAFVTDRDLASGMILYPDVFDPSLFLKVGCFKIHEPWELLDWKETKIVVI